MTNPEQIKEGSFSFRFSGVPKGFYCVIAFQDSDGNGKLTCTTWSHIKEPISHYKEPAEAPIGVSAPGWDDVKFELVADMNGIIMKLD